MKSTSVGTFLTAVVLATATAAPVHAQGPGEGHEGHMKQGGEGGHGMMKHMHRYPSALMGVHMMHPGAWMLSYRFMRMDMDGNRDGTDDLTPAQVRGQGFAVVPTEMTMDMHMLGVMYGVREGLTLSAMLPYISNEMDHIAGRPLGAVRFTTESDGIGDVKAGALIRVFDWGERSLHANAVVSLPTGSIDKRDAPPGQLPYPMQLGSGTYDVTGGFTYTAHKPSDSYGAQALGTVRLGENDRDYTLGGRAHLGAWYSHDLGDELALQLRLDFHTWGNIDGADAELNSGLVPTADPDRRGGERLDVGIGVAKGLRGWQIAFDLALPLHQDLDGPQLETDNIFSFTVKKHL